MAIAEDPISARSARTAGDPTPPVELTVIMPCLNEAETLERCIGKALRAIRENNIAGEVLVADNGSTDGSREIASRLGARVVTVDQRGYGSALLGGIAAARGKYLVMGDADDSYDFLEVPRFLAKLREGYDLVMGNRFLGGVEPGAMPPLHRYLGNPVLTGIGRLFFGSPCGDFHCGLRGISRQSAVAMDLQCPGMEFASEMVIKATLQKLRIAEIPTTLSPDGRSRPPHLRSWRDGWRHLRFMLLYSPNWLFLYPGLGLMLVGLAVGAWLLPGPRRVSGVTLDVHTLLYMAIALLVGFQSVLFAVFSKVFAVAEGLLPPNPRLDRFFDRLTLEFCLGAGGLMVLAGLGGGLRSVLTWKSHAFGQLDASAVMRTAIPSAVLLLLGCQLVFASFFLGILRLPRRSRNVS